MHKTNAKFWTVQLLGWGTLLVINTILQGGVGGKNPYALVGSIYMAINGIALTTAFRSFILWRKWEQKRPEQLVLRVFVASAVVAIAWAVATLYMVAMLAWWRGDPFKVTSTLLLGNFISGQLLMLIWSACYFAYHYFLRYNRAEVEKWKLEAIAKEAQLGLLKSQINPHFMFNALNNIRALILEDRDKAREMLIHLSDFMRYSLTYAKSETVDVKTEVEVVRQYLQLLSIQYEDKPGI